MVQNGFVVNSTLQLVTSGMDFGDALGRLARLHLVGGLTIMITTFAAIAALLLSRNAWAVFLAIAALWMSTLIVHLTIDWASAHFLGVKSTSGWPRSNLLGFIIAGAATGYLLLSERVNRLYGLSVRQTVHNKAPTLWHKLRGRSALND